METVYQLQNFVFPTLDVCSDESLYIRAPKKTITDLNKAKIEVLPNGSFSLDTYFNAFTVNTWKNKSVIEDLHITLKGAGDFCVRIELHRKGHSSRIIQEEYISLSPEGATIPVKSWSSLEGGLLYLSLYSQKGGHIDSGYYGTITKPKREVHLGLVVTHFNRQNYVIPALNRLENGLFSKENIRNNVKMLVIDNSNNLDFEATNNISVIPNLNLGGSGGFTRGLLELEQAGSFTHCLFMDDDATCEIDSIERTYNLLQFSKEDNLAMVGSLLREIEPYRLYEKGAKFIDHCLPLKQGLDMRDINHLLEAEDEYDEIGYGGWWFFAFPIEKVEHYPFPFFVRGDDILFSLMNSFDLVTLNGVACWAEDFEQKEGPFQRYLDLRRDIVIKYYMGFSTKRIMISNFKFFLTALLSLNYESAQSAILALNHAKLGENFWRDNMDTSQIRQSFSELVKIEKLKPVDLKALEKRHGSQNESKTRKLIRLVTLNGFLIPKKFFKDSVLIHEKGFKGWARMTFLAKKILYIHSPSGMGYITEHDKCRAYNSLKDYFSTALRFYRQRNKIESNYRESLANLTKKEFWKSVYYEQLKKESNNDK